jgi:hypothetical protein
LERFLINTGKTAGCLFEAVAEKSCSGLLGDFNGLCETGGTRS